MNIIFINVQNISVVDTIRHKILNRLRLWVSGGKIQVPEAKQAMEQFKMEAANEVGVNLKQGYNGDLTAKQAGSIGGQMVKKMIADYESRMK